jgi:hypothetical protein
VRTGTARARAGGQPCREQQARGHAPGGRVRRVQGPD